MSPALHAAQIALLNDQTRLPTTAQFFIVAAVMVTKWDRHRRTRKALGKLDKHILNDIGLTKPTAMNDAQKPFWQD